MYLRPPAPLATFGLSYTAILHTILPLLFKYCIACPPGQTFTPSSLHLLSLRSLHCRPRPAPKRPSRPLKPHSACPFMLPRPPSVRSPFADLNVVIISDDHYDFSLIGSVLPPPLNQTNPPHWRPRPASRSLPFLSRFVFQFSGLLSSCPL